MSRTEDKRAFDRSFLNTGFICGVDEAGRGCLAGPVVAAAVVFDVERLPFLPLDDSKKLSPKERERLFDLVVSSSICWAVGVVGPAKIDQINILNATKIAIISACSKLKTRPDFVLIDGNMKLDLDLPYASVVKGDAKSFCIAAASVVAKVTRDRIMERYSKVFPGYGFAEHKGYPTRLHRKRIEELGILPIHRRSFRLWTQEKSSAGGERN